jgi:hypothetical protein
MVFSSIGEYTARIPSLGYFTIRPFRSFAAGQFAVQRGILFVNLLSGLLPKNSSTFAVSTVYHIGFIYGGAVYSMGIYYESSASIVKFD